MNKTLNSYTQKPDIRKQRYPAIREIICSFLC